MKTIYTVNGAGIDGTFNSLDEALDAWKAAGCPVQTGSSVWVTKTFKGDTLATFTLTRTAGGGILCNLN